MKVVHLTALVLVVSAVASCSDVTGPSPAPAVIAELPRALSQAERDLIAADQVFALKLFREIEAEAAPDANGGGAPLSVSMALGMTYIRV